jgi:hypothetical protein
VDELDVRQEKFPMRTILIVFAMLIAWKVVRTDWIVICPWWEGNDDILGSPSGLYDATYRPPVSPAWSPPDPMTSGILDVGSGASFAVGNPWVRPYWELIALKVGFPLMLICSVHVLRFLIKRRGVVTDYVRSLITESKRQNKSCHPTGISPPIPPHHLPQPRPRMA